MKSVYVCYQSVLEPLTHTQVVAYLEGLAAAGHEIHLLTFEPTPIPANRENEVRAGLKARGIEWTHLQYHKRPSAPATAWDVLQGVREVLRLVRTRGIELVHARAHVPALIGMVTKNVASTKLLVDFRALIAEEYAAGGVWKNGGAMYRATKRIERNAFAAADGVVVLTDAGRSFLEDIYGPELGHKPLSVIPCCVDLRDALSAEPGLGARPGLRLGYVGKLRGRYWTEAMIAFVARALRRIPDLEWHVWTQDDATAFLEQCRIRGIEAAVRIRYASPGALRDEITTADAGLAFYRPNPGNVATWPTKVGEYLGAGLPVVANTGVGDLDRLLGAGCPNVGVLVDDLSDAALDAALDELLRIIADPLTRGNCTAAARKHLDLVEVGWPRYRDLYTRLQNGSNGA